MHKKEQSLQKHLNDALIEISESNPRNSLELLAESGINANSLMKNSLERIKGYSLALSRKVKDDHKRTQLAELKNKLSEYLMVNPEMTAKVIHNFIQGKSPNLQFQANAKLDESVFEEIGNLSSLKDLIKKLESELESQ